MKKLFLGVVCVALLFLTTVAMAQTTALTLHPIPNGKSHNGKIQHSSPPSYCSPCLFYGGDWNDTSSDWVIFANGNSYGWSGGSTVDDVNIYSSFTVPSGQTWTVTGLFANVGFININKMDPATPHWKVSQGMKAGFRGDTINCGDTAGTAKPTGRSADSGAGEVTEYTVLVKLPHSMKLSAGTYTESVTPQCKSASLCSSAYFYESDTFNSDGSKQGANAFGPPEPAGGNFQNGAAFGLNYQAINGAYCSSLGYQSFACNWMSDGVLGTSGTF
jgi:hypothetical protein